MMSWLTKIFRHKPKPAKDVEFGTGDIETDYQDAERKICDARDQLIIQVAAAKTSARRLARIAHDTEEQLEPSILNPTSVT